MKLMTDILRWSLAVCTALALAAPAAAQTTSSDDWKISIYPVFAWVPIEIAIDVNVPPVSGGGGSGPEFGGKIVDGRLDGAFFGGLSAAKGRWRIDADGLWAGVGGDRLENPVLRVDVDAIYAHGAVGLEIYPDLYATVGVRRMAMKYEIELAGRQFERKPGLWDPVLGVAWHRETGNKLDFHVAFEGGGFGVGSDVEIATGARLDWKLATHFGITAGYNLLYFKLSHTVGDRTFTAKQTIHGPAVGIGLYF
jgi:hypothetical protein